MKHTKHPSNASCNDLIREIDACETDYDLFRILKLICVEYQCKKFIVCVQPRVVHTKLQDQIIISNWNPELVRELDIRKAPHFANVFAKLVTSVAPLYTMFPMEISDLEPDGDSGDGGDGQIGGDATAQAGELCVFIPVFDRLGARGVVGFSGVVRGDEDNLLRLGYLAGFVFDKLQEIRASTTVSNNVLSNREIECLNWTAQGKTSFEIGVILNISLNTVNQYLSSASRKLNCVNKTHAVVKCLQNGIF